MPDAPQDERTGLQPTEMAPQPHGGAIRVGNPGNRGGPGRPRNPIKAIAAEGLRETLEEARARVKAAKQKGAKRMSAYELAQYGALFAKVATDSAGEDQKPPARIHVLSATVETIGPALEAERQAEDGDERLTPGQEAEDPATPSAGGTSSPAHIPQEAPSGDNPGEQPTQPGPIEARELPGRDVSGAADAERQPR